MSTDLTTERKLIRTAPADLWATLAEAAPEMAEAVRRSPALPRYRYGDYEGFREWLVLEFAMNTPSRLIRDKLRVIRDGQEADSIDALWPEMSKAQVDGARKDLAPEWQPIRARIEDQIAQAGIANKTSRLMAYQQMAEEIAELMFEERNEKTGQLYLLRDYRETLRAVAEEMGDLGKPAEDEREGLMDIAKELISVIKVQGSGLQDTTSDNSQVFDYEEGVWRDA